MQIKHKKEALVKDLRRKGLSFNEIKKQVNISKSSISRWCRNIKLSPKQSQRLLNSSIKGLEKGRQRTNDIRKNRFEREMKTLGISLPKIQELYWEKEYDVPRIAKIFGVKNDYIYSLMRKYGIYRRKGTEVNYLNNRYKPQFRIKEKLTFKEKKLKIAGIMLYWAEGAKNSNGINFSNSDSKMIQLFLVFLRRICGINDSRLRVHLYAYSNQDLDKLKTYWQKITNIPISQFNKPYIRKNDSNKSGRKLAYGLVQIRYNDKRLLETVKCWINEYYLDINDWAGTLVAKGDRLCQTQRFVERLNGKVGEFRGTLNIFNDEGNPEPSSDVISGKVQRLSRKGVARRLSVEAPTA